MSCKVLEDQEYYKKYKPGLPIEELAEFVEKVEKRKGTPTFSCFEFSVLEKAKTEYERRRLAGERPKVTVEQKEERKKESPRIPKSWDIDFWYSGNLL